MSLRQEHPRTRVPSDGRLKLRWAVWLGLGLHGICAHALPVITNVVPGSAPTQGGMALDVVGSGFSGVNPASVTVGGTAAAVSFASDTSIRFSLPSFGGGSRSQPLIITVDGGSSAPYSFQYDLPTLSSLSPSAGASGGGLVEVFGSSFGPGDQVFFGASAATLVSFDYSHLQVLAPLYAGGSLTVPVTLHADGHVSNSLAFTYAAVPEPSSLVLLGLGLWLARGQGRVASSSQRR